LKLCPLSYLLILPLPKEMSRSFSYSYSEYGLKGTFLAVYLNEINSFIIIMGMKPFRRFIVELKTIWCSVSHKIIEAAM